MTVTVKLFATLRNNREKIMTMELPEQGTTAYILEEIGIGQEEVAIIMINGRGAKIDQEIEDQDVVSIFPPVGGG